MKKIAGVGVSNGLACGKVLKIEIPHFNVTNTKLNDGQIEAAMSQYHQAVSDTISQLEKMSEIVENKIGKNEAKIFQAHIQILSDPMLADKISDLIKNEKSNPAHAVEVVFKETHDLFQQMNDAYLSQRASDIEDVMNNLLSVLLKQPLPNFLLIDEPVIVAINDLKPSQASMIDANYVKGVITETGSKTNHAAFIIQAANIPAVFGATGFLGSVKKDEQVALNGTDGEVYCQMDKDELNKISTKVDEYNKYRDELMKYASLVDVKTSDKCKIWMAANVGSVDDMNKINKLGVSSVGLFRTEFLYIESDDWPTEDEQFEVYKNVLMKANGEPVVIRTLDIGGDKVLNYFQFDKEENPFLGFRAIRFCLANEKIFRTQLRALIRASVYGKLHIMFPMIATINELMNAKSIFHEECQKLVKEKNMKIPDIKLGMMVEVPAAAVLADEFAKHVDFFSIGTNDLIQYTLACDRTLKKVSYLYQGSNPSVLRLIKSVIDASHKNKIWTGMCGGMASDPLLIPVLIGLGLDEFSMAINSILENKKLITSVSYKECKKLANEVIKMSDSNEIQKKLVDFIKWEKLVV